MDTNMEAVKSVEPARRLFENLFIRRHDANTFQVLSDGIAACIQNARRLYDDANLLFKKDKWPSGTFLLTTAHEEIAKTYIIVDMCRLDPYRHRSTLIRLCYAFYDHIYKYAYSEVAHLAKDQNIQDAQRDWQECLDKWTPDVDDGETSTSLIHETHFLRELPIYIDFLDYAQRWSAPRADLAEYTYSMGLGIVPARTALECLEKTLEIGLFSPTVLGLVNREFSRHYISDKTVGALVRNLHAKTAQIIQKETGIPEIAYLESALNAIPLYHFTTLRT
jgi:AbiV family abortive infection protein